MWIKSSRCDTGHCVRVSVGAGSVWVGDSADDPRGEVPVLAVPHGAWQQFVDGLKTGGVDR